MIEDIIRDLEAKIRAGTMSDSAKNDLLKSVTALKAEIAVPGKTEETDREKEKLKSSVDDLRSSVAEFEQTHPKLIETVNSISTTLSNLGI